MKKNLIVSSADNKYFKLLCELINSIKFENKDQNYDIAVLSINLSNENLEILNNLSIQYKEPVWNVKVPKYKIQGRDHLKTQVSRFYLEEYFPGYENYIWMDSDIWINSFDEFKLYERGSSTAGFAITPQVDRAYHQLVNIKWIGPFPSKINSINYKNISKSISFKEGRNYAGYLTLNAGCFSYNKNFDGMNIIRKNLEKAALKGRIFGSDQVALCLSVFRDKIITELLPSYCNWMCDFHLPKYSLSSKKFVEPYIPNNPIACMHLAGMDRDRFNDSILHTIQSLEGNKLDLSLRFNHR